MDDMQLNNTRQDQPMSEISLGFSELELVIIATAYQN